METYNEACTVSDRSLVINYDTAAEFTALRVEVIRLSMPTVTKPPEVLDFLKSTRERLVLSNGSSINLVWNKK